MASLQLLTAPVSVTTPVLNTAGKSFANNYNKLAAPNLTAVQRKAIRITSLIHQLQTVASIDYRTKHSQLIQDASVYMVGLSNFMEDYGLAVTDWQGGFNADSGGLTNDIAAILLEGRDFASLPEQQLDRIIVFIRAALVQ